MVKKKYKLHCFECGHILEKKEDVFRNLSNYPICEECLRESLDEYEDYMLDSIVAKIRKDFNNNYNKFWEWDN